MSRMRRGLVVGLVVALVAIAVIVVVGGYGRRAPPSPEAQTRGAVDAPQGVPATGVAGAPTARPAAGGRAKLTPAARARILAALERAQAARGATPAPAPRPAGGTMPVLRADGGVVGSLDKEYLRASIRELVPLVKECYVNALRDQPDLGGRLTVEFRIAGEPEIGGVVTESRIVETDAGTLHAGLEECVRETMYGLQLDAPAGGGTVQVRYPFIFRSR